MSKQQEALRLALEALKQIDEAMPFPVAKLAQQVIREALAEQPAQQQEPYGWKVYGVNSLFMGEFAEADAKAEAKHIGGTCIAFPLYTSPPASKPWVGLTDEEVTSVWHENEPSPHLFARAIEAKLREKNT